MNNRTEHNYDSPLSIHSMTVAYGKKPVLWEVEYDAPTNSLIGIIGPNGAGKSSLLKGCLGLAPTISGDIRFWGETIDSVSNRIAYVPQRNQFDLNFPINGREVVEMGLYGKIGWFKKVTKQDQELIDLVLEKVGMSAHANKQISEYSGGQLQRILLARALVQNADLLLLDEPFAGIDITTEETIIEILRDLVKNHNKTVLCVHHDLFAVPEYFSDLILVNGRIINHGKTSDVFNIDNLGKTFGGKVSILEQLAHQFGKIES